MTQETTNQQKSQTNRRKGITFECKLCGQNKPLDNMKKLPQFFPPVFCCSDCAKKY